MTSGFRISISSVKNMAANPTKPLPLDEPSWRLIQKAKSCRAFTRAAPLYSNDLPARSRTTEVEMRVPAFLAEHRVDCETLIGGNGYFLAVLPATHHVETSALADALGVPVRLAHSEEVADVFRDCEWGAIPPFGALYGLPTVLDDDIDADRILVFEGHTHGVAIRMRCRDFERYERPRRLSFARPASLPVS
jgi:prolyl-tRNA editing enzyme YbaK/EbsC (Cys-tRNA(Pro) deacylase)